MRPGDRAKSRLVHYFEQAILRSGGQWERDNIQEVESIVDDIVEAAKAATKACNSGTATPAPTAETIKVELLSTLVGQRNGLLFCLRGLMDDGPQDHPALVDPRVTVRWSKQPPCEGAMANTVRSGKR